MSSGGFERLLAESERYAEQFDRGDLAPHPSTGLTLLTCMDARIVVEDIFGLRPGDAHVLRNAGAFASEDVIRSVIVSQRLLGTAEVVVLGHTGCGMHTLDEAALRAQLERDTGAPSDVEFGSFQDVEAHVREQVRRIGDHPWTRPVPIHGLVYDVTTGRVREVA